jgi:cysteine desulfurase / selenocysteine lyase
MIYLNNAATSYPKPSCVLEAFDACVKMPPSSQFRSAVTFGKIDILEECRRNLGHLFGIKETNRIFFASGATEAMNMVICGLPLAGKQILTTQTEHNSVLRPLMNHPDFAGKSRVIIAPCGKNGKVDTDMLENLVTEKTGAFIVNHCSNVTGMVQNMEKIARFAKKHSLMLIVDASQSAGCIPIDADGWGVDALVFTGHKSLFGVQGTGGFYIRNNIGLFPTKFGGTGRNSAQLTYQNKDYEYEVGTQNTPGISALNAGVCYILNVGLQSVIERESYCLKRLYHGLDEISSVITYGTYEENKGPVISFNINGLSPSDVAYILYCEYEIVVRAGLHCSPLIHESLGTKKNGTVRISISYLTTDAEIDSFLKAVSEIGRTAGKQP